MKLDIVYEDEYLIACVKPYGVPSQLDKTYGVDMITLVKEYLYDKEVAAADYVKTKTAFEAGVSLYEQNVHKLTQAGQFVPAMLLGLHKKIVAAYRRFYLGCAKMNQALDYEKHTVASDMFNQAEKEQNQAMDDISKDVQKMMQKMM